MKRAASPPPPTRHRQTRSVARRLNEEAQHEQENERRQSELKERAETLMETSELQALPMVLSSGFLYKYQCMNAAVTCKNWHSTWMEVQNHLPVSCQVEIALRNITRNSNAALPRWVLQKGLEDVIGSSEFVRQVVDKVNAMKVAAKPSKNKRAAAQAALPKWGIDIHRVNVIVWEANTYNNGGICIVLYKNKSFYSVPSDDMRWTCRLRPDLTLWAGIRAWRVYDGEPLWS
jgi:hypothetical protein